jgi:serine/threonine-protein kinase
MFEALRQAEAVLSSRAQSSIGCPACGHVNPGDVRFCGACGGRLVEIATLPPAPPSARTSSPELRATASPRASISSIGGRPMLGREAEVEALLAARQDTSSHPVWVHVQGESGVGKTRLLAEYAHRASGLGDVVVMAAPHPTGVPVPYHAVAGLLAGLLDVDESFLLRWSTGGPAISGEDAIRRVVHGARIEALSVDPMTAAGLAELGAPSGLPGPVRRSRAGAVAVALAAAVQAASPRASSGRILLVVDDLPRCDALTREALGHLMIRAAVSGLPLLLLTASSSSREGAPHPDCRVLPLRGIEVPALLAIDGAASPADTTAPSGAPAMRLVLPLQLEQARALVVGGVDGPLPPRLADLIMARLDRLERGARRVLQAAAVLGDGCTLSALRGVAAAEDLDRLDALVRQRLVTLGEERLQLVHPLVREIAEASIPSEARRALHARALAVAAATGASLEVRAEHACRASDLMTALLLLERCGDAALVRGDATGATHAYRRGVEVARRELLESGEEIVSAALVTFGRKLGQALEHAGDAAGAEGVLREALDMAGPEDKERARILVVLGRVATARDRRREAQRWLGQALEVAHAAGAPMLTAEAHLALSALRHAEGDTAAAVDAFRRGRDLLAGDQAAFVQLRASAGLGHVERLLATEPAVAPQVIEHGVRLVVADAAASASPALVAHATGLDGLSRLRLGDDGRGWMLLKDAESQATLAGDVESRDRWRAAAERALDPVS